MAVEREDYYEVLGISRDASSEDVKKAYRKAAFRWHPDKNPHDKEHASTMFKSAAEAYEVLADPQKRLLYDRGGKEALKGGLDFGSGRGGASMGEAFDIFRKFFGGRDPFADMNRMFEDMQLGRGLDGDRRKSTRGMASMFGVDSFSGMSSGSFRSSSNGGGTDSGVVSSSIKIITKIVDGQRVTVTEKTVRNADGTVESTRSESTSESSQDGNAALQVDFFGGSGGFFGEGGRRGRSAVRRSAL